MQELFVEELMTKDVVAVEPDAPLLDVCRTLSSRRLSCVVVCQGPYPIGIVTERDVARAVARHPDGPGGLRAEEVMSSPVVAVEATTPLGRAVAETSSRGIRRLVVRDDEGLLVGLVTQTDLVRAHARELERLVEARTRALSEANAELERLSRVDALLGIGNRLALDSDLERLHTVAVRYGRPYSVALFDVDRFKAYNDGYGHLAGDAILRGVAERLSQTLRRADTLFRYGGDEMLALLPETSLGGAARAAQRGRRAVTHGLASPDGCGGVTLSCGVASLELPRDAEEGLWTVVDRADGALREAKRAGRNRVHCAPAGSEAPGAGGRPEA